MLMFCTTIRNELEGKTTISSISLISDFCLIQKILLELVFFQVPLRIVVKKHTLIVPLGCKGYSKPSRFKF